MIKKENPVVCCLQQTYVSLKDTHKVRVKGWGKKNQTNGNQRKAGVAILRKKTKKQTEVA